MERGAQDGGPAGPGVGQPGVGQPGVGRPGGGRPGAGHAAPGTPPGELAGPEPGRAAEDSLPLLPGFREMALRRMAAERRRLVAGLAAQRQSAGMSQTEVAARMGTSQSAVARLEAGEADVRVSTLERYAAAIGSQITWRAGVGAGRGQEEESG